MNGIRTETFPPEGAFRIHRAPTMLRPRDGYTGAGPDRFDDPKNNYRVRYFASSLRGCLLEVLDHFRGDATAEREFAATKGLQGMDIFDEEPAGLVPDGWLSRQRVTIGRVLAGRAFVDVSDIDTMAALERTSGVRQVLRSDVVRRAFGPNVRLDLGTICAAGPAGRAVTQAVSQAVFIDPSQPSGISYLTRFDRNERCWAAFDERTKIEFSEPEPLDYFDPQTRAAAQSVAATYGLKLPAQWY